MMSSIDVNLIIWYLSLLVMKVRYDNSTVKMLVMFLI